MQRRFVWVFLLIGLTGVAAGPVALRAQITPTPAASVPLALAAEKGLTPANSKGESTWDFGTRKVQANAVITHAFTLRNIGAKPLTIDSVLTSCHCTTATVGTGSEKHEPSAFVLEPGKTVALHVAIDTALAHAVDFRKIVWVYVKGRDDAALTLTVTGHLDSTP